MPDSPYDELAEIYDQFQKDIDTAKWADYLDALIKRFGPASGDGKDGRLLLCDLGCGTAGVTIEMNRRGYESIGIDQSMLMLDKAREKSLAAGEDILFLCQDITGFELFGTVDVFICLLDTVNHIVDHSALQNMFLQFENYLNPGGLFIFDAATPHHLKKTLGNHFFYTIDEDYALMWENSFSSKTQISTSDLTLFRLSEKDMYRRYEGQIRERVYTEAQICGYLENAGMKLLAKYGELTCEEPLESSTREFYIAVRPPANDVRLETK
jgi:SAM-dependent methyltransferase